MIFQAKLVSHVFLPQKRREVMWSLQSSLSVIHTHIRPLRVSKQSETIFRQKQFDVFFRPRKWRGSHASPPWKSPETDLHSYPCSPWSKPLEKNFQSEIIFDVSLTLEVADGPHDTDPPWKWYETDSYTQIRFPYVWTLFWKMGNVSRFPDPNSLRRTLTNVKDSRVRAPPFNKKIDFENLSNRFHH